MSLLLQATPTPTPGTIALTWDWDSEMSDGTTFRDYISATWGSVLSGTGKLLKRRGGYARSDGASGVVSLATFATAPLPSGAQSYDDNDVEPGVTYYYTLALETTSGRWVYLFHRSIEKHGDNATVAKAYAYKTWGFGPLMFNLLPPHYQRADGDSGGHLEAFLSIFGYLFDGAKTDVEQLLTLTSVDEIDARLLGDLAHKIGWQVNWELDERRARAEVNGAAALYKIKGTMTSLESAIQNATGWDATAYEGWKYLMFSNVAGCTTVDTTNAANILAARGSEDDLLRYTPNLDGESWLVTNGMLLLLDEVSGSEEFSHTTLAKVLRLYPEFLAAYALLNLMLRPSTATESYDVASEVDEEYSTELESSASESYEASSSVVESAPSATIGSGFRIFYSNDGASTTNTRKDMVPHSAFVYT